MSTDRRRSARSVNQVISPLEEESDNEEGHTVESEDGDDGEDDKDDVEGAEGEASGSEVPAKYNAQDSDMDIEEDEDDDELSESPAPAQATRPRGTLVFKLKLPKVPASSASNTATPAPEEYKVSPSKRTSGRARRVIPEYNESSEDEVDNDADDMSISDESEEVTKLSPSKRLTSRQAVLANAADASHVSLAGDSTPSGRASKKKQLNETELALRREETARKRKNMTEKKLEDEKAETINRLLKKQSRPRGKRGAAAAAAAAAAARADASKADSGEEEMEVDETPAAPPPEPEAPTKYRWITTSRSPPKAEGAMDVEGDNTPTMSLFFAVPPNLLTQAEQTSVIKPKQLCGIKGCGQDRKYRLIKDFERGACGMAHLKLLQA